ncbi:MAG TPA: universal stress protein [Thermoleophilaceae bacterium]|nr:universal stress protein [Thermoleophilaceae bacterium]
MSNPILVGYDPRTADRGPVSFGVAVARLTRVPLLVAAVEAHHRANGQVDEDLLADCTRAIEAIEAELRAAGLPVPADCRTLKSTSAARALLEAAAGEEAARLVVGSSRRSPHERVLAGWTAMRLLHGAPCPVSVVPRGWSGGEGLRTIGVACADSEEGREALRAAHALARRAGATLRVVTVITVSAGMYAEIEPSYKAGQFGRDLEDVEGEHKLRAEKWLRQAVAQLDGDVPVEVEAFVGDPAETLVSLSEHLDLLVCGSRGYGPVGGVLLGSVSRRLAAEARCPLLVLPRGVRAPLDALAAEPTPAESRSGGGLDQPVL